MTAETTANLPIPPENTTLKVIHRELPFKGRLAVLFLLKVHFQGAEEPILEQTQGKGEAQDEVAEKNGFQEPGHGDLLPFFRGKKQACPAGREYTGIGRS
ncbi:hypothetical protein [uncultured Oscillibacter sp.]|uniref:hypothetical protein n=1 Tax=uncultured Oscillibacter sp. TaxID=876091 RepID=UPI0025D39A38|nr:hypothetical protein [uncultured Oscillibacter sp.]